MDTRNIFLSVDDFSGKRMLKRGSFPNTISIVHTVGASLVPIGSDDSLADKERRGFFLLRTNIPRTIQRGAARQGVSLLAKEEFARKSRERMSVFL